MPRITTSLLGALAPCKLETLATESSWLCRFDAFAQRVAVFYEAYELTRRVILIAITAALSQDSANKYTYMAFCFILFLILHTYAHPYTEINDNKAESLSLAALLICTTFLIVAPSPMDTARADGLSLLVFIVAVALLMRINIVSDIVDIIRGRRTGAAERRLRAQPIDPSIELRPSATQLQMQTQLPTTPRQAPVPNQITVQPAALPPSAMIANGHTDAEHDGLSVTHAL